MKGKPQSPQLLTAGLKLNSIWRVLHFATSGPLRKRRDAIREEEYLLGASFTLVGASFTLENKGENVFDGNFVYIRRRGTIFFIFF